MSGESGFLRSLVRGGALALGAKLITYPVGLVLAIILARALTAAELGAYFLAMSLILIGAALTQFGMGRVTVKYVARSLASHDMAAARDVVRKGLVWISMLGLLIVGVLLAGAGNVIFGALEAGRELHTAAWAISLLIPAYAVVEYSCEVMRGLGRLELASIFADQMSQRVLLMLALGVALIAGIELRFDSVMALALVSTVVAALVGLALVSRLILFANGGDGSIVPFRLLLSETPPFFLLRLNIWLTNTAPVLVLGLFEPPEQVALFGIANLIALLSVAPWMVANASLPQAVVKLYSDGRSRAIERMLGMVAAATLAVSVLIALLFVLFGKPLLGLVFGDALVAAYSATVILVLGRVLMLTFGAPALLLSMTEHQSTVSNIVSTTSLVGLVAGLLAARFGGILWMAIALSATLTIQAVSLHVAARRILGISTLPRLTPRDWLEAYRYGFGRP